MFINFRFTDSFPQPFIRPIDIVWMFKSMGILSLLFISLFCLDRFVFSKKALDLRQII